MTRNSVVIRSHVSYALILIPLTLLISAYSCYPSPPLGERDEKESGEIEGEGGFRRKWRRKGDDRVFRYFK